MSDLLGFEEMPLSKDEAEALQGMLDGAVERILDKVALREDTEIAMRDLSQRAEAIEKTTAVLAPSLVKLTEEVRSGFRDINGRLDALEQRVARIEERFDRFSRDSTRGRTSDSERIAALEKRVAELEAKLAEKH